MDNNGSTNKYSIETKDHLYQEMVALHGRIEKFIGGISSKVEQKNHAPTKSAGVKSGVLMTHEFKVREAIQSLEDMNEEQWLESKADLQELFKDANKALNETIN